MNIVVHFFFEDFYRGGCNKGVRWEIERIWSSLSKVRSGKTSQYRKVKRQISYSSNEDEFQISSPTP